MTEREALKVALEALNHYEKAGLATVKTIDAITAIKEVLAQKEHEPVAWMYQDKSTHQVSFQKHMKAFVDHSKTSEVPLYGKPLANHELQCVCGAVWCGDEMVHLPNKTPPQRTWVGLTDEEFQYCVELKNPESIAEEVEAKLKEKNT